MSLDLSPRPGVAAPGDRVIRHALLEASLLLRNGEQLLLALPGGGEDGPRPGCPSAHGEDPCLGLGGERAGTVLHLVDPYARLGGGQCRSGEDPLVVGGSVPELTRDASPEDVFLAHTTEAP